MQNNLTIYKKLIQRIATAQSQQLRTKLQKKGGSEQCNPISHQVVEFNSSFSHYLYKQWGKIKQQEGKCSICFDTILDERQVLKKCMKCRQLLHVQCLANWYQNEPLKHTRDHGRGDCPDNCYKKAKSCIQCRASNSYRDYIC